MNFLHGEKGFVIRQRKEMWEVFTDIETVNRYDIYDLEGNQVFHAYEESKSFFFSWIMRMVLVAMRPFSIKIINESQQLLLEIKRPFRFYFHMVEINDQDGVCLGCVKKRFSIFHKHYTVYDTSDNAICDIKGPFWKPWTFDIYQGDTLYGSIKKKWGGALREIFTDADVFGVDFPVDASLGVKALLFGSVFLIDFVHFEGNEGTS